MLTLIEIQAKIAELQAQERAALAEEYAGKRDEAQKIITAYGIKSSDLVFAVTESEVKKVKAASKKAEIKYRDTNGNSWSGRGLKPRWLAAALESGKTLESFATAAAAAPVAQ